MYEDFLAAHINELRQAKNVSARDMSIKLGQNVNYINHIESKKTLPSMRVFFYICDYLNVTPQEFFDEKNAAPKLLNELDCELKSLNKNALEHLCGFIREMGASKNKSK